MAEVQVNQIGDSVSKLLQVQAVSVGLRRTWTGKGAEDARAVMVALHNAERLKSHIWKAVQELYAMPELKTLPEAVQAKLMATILSARGCAELEMKS